MKKLALLFMLIYNVIISQTVPKSLKIRFTKFLELHNYSNIELDNALSNPDTILYKPSTSCYVIDFEHNQILLYQKDSLVAQAPIVSIHFNVAAHDSKFENWDFVIKLQDYANDTEIRINMQHNTFIYSYVFDIKSIGYYERITAISRDVVFIP